ncbi:MAG: NADH:flavin oxidoreductase/NADH oxidase family protein [Aquabacterium sp.]|uniref:NADH:flavin oxidoreductase/NADH oxidase family protein n=1 Tax=Aquabacterium sp. TaxID=1872578 RepID=UPI0025C1402A|nr:NADH:flavin oxidoreductase/NADH oxidase family protein [Aquabacterium sp.]MBI5925389.1 NADH:flavin oxidoreductase/NADH oxidase family protein [Aquabacterium sp.]
MNITSSFAPSSSTDGSAVSLGQSFKLRNGVAIKNRLVKSALHESMGDKKGRPLDCLLPLYKAWAEGGIGLSITGNVMVDQRARSEPGNVVVEDERHLAFLKQWAEAGSRNGTALWMQINHPGKQAMIGLNKETVAPSAIPFKPELAPFFGKPREMTPAEIEDTIVRFGRTARIAKQAGFGGVQIHAAHGYLISQFLSPHHNRRSDKWGGSADNRRRFLMAVYRSMREAVGPDFPIGIKLNSADFQRGGFNEAESMDAVLAIAEAGIDMVEISGGTYEAPAMTGSEQPIKDSTRQREAYFMDFAEQVRQQTKVPLMVTGGFRSVAGMQEALASGSLDFIGLGRLMCIDASTPQRLLAGLDPQYAVSPRVSGIGYIDRSRMMEVIWYSHQLMRIAREGQARPNESVLKVALTYLVGNFLKGEFSMPKFRAS